MKLPTDVQDPYWKTIGQGGKKLKTTHETYDASLPCSWIGRINIVQRTILPKAVCRFSAIPSKILMAFFTKLEQIV